MSEPDEDVTIREVSYGAQTPSERLEESAVDVAALVLSAGALGFGGVQAYYSRASYALQSAEAADRAAGRAEVREMQRQWHEARRMEAFERGGLCGLDDFDQQHFDGPFLGFGPDD